MASRAVTGPRTPERNTPGPRTSGRHVPGRDAGGRNFPGPRTRRARVPRRRGPADRPLPRRGVARVGGRTVAWLAVYALGLAACHYLVIAPAFAYLGFEKVPPNPLVAIVVAPTYLLCARRLPLSWERPSAIVYWMLFLVVVAPVHVLPMFITDRSTAVWLMVGGVAAAFWLLGGIYSVPLWTFRPPAIPARVYWPAYALLWLVMTGVVVGYYGLHLRLVSLSEIYAVRDTYRNSFGEVPKVATYVVPWLGNVIAPVAIARGLMTRRWSWAALGVLTELYLVSITGFKQLLFSSLLAAGVVVLARTTDLARIGRRVGVLAACGVFAVTVIDFARGGWGLSSILVRRLVLTSAVNTEYHFEFFLQNPKGHLGYGVLSHWVAYPYDLKPPFLIGQVFYGNPEMSANANLWADAYANFGLVGVFVFTGILAVVLHFADSAARGLPGGLALAALAQSAFSVSNTAMLTVFLTHGMLLAVAVVYLMPAGDDATRRKPRRPGLRRIRRGPPRTGRTRRRPPGVGRPRPRLSGSRAPS
ncbi:hypothetical protein SAMN05421678_113106 [Actinopolymorpha cephalotaxi]|uniref:O-antigen ligase n=1 Tax=Actinopolymorpha cephalotaxi TaxID=504797 RepID=A0A1I2XYV9_9ACTN|nr:hypothetical protein [Actinopolymorpha cephalotaxi]NYH87226.1 hypothetical protein [Actinopolymorpha cephalotaxi]SFH17906.1 hypothetical protein SAMN05421678_113106 [Actinopolymorpha cephalotaxi]